MNSKRLNYLTKYMGDDWLDKIQTFIDDGSMDKTLDAVAKEIKSGKQIYPSQEDIFRIFYNVPLKDVKVVILGQDPYYTPGVANGFAFAVNSSKIPPSLKNIEREIRDSHYDSDKDKNIRYLSAKFDYTLESWAEQGVFLLNTALTVEENKPNSHVKFWKSFINFVFLQLNNKDSVVYMLWGNNAKKYKELITNETAHILESPHPSPLAKGFNGNGHFIKCNEILKNNGIGKIKWL